MLARILKHDNRPPWQRSVLELYVTADIPDYRGIRKALDNLRADSIR